MTQFIHRISTKQREISHPVFPGGLRSLEKAWEGSAALIITPPNAVSATDCRASVTVASLSMSAFGGVMIKAGECFRISSHFSQAT
jgi:hypothetical protein